MLHLRKSNTYTTRSVAWSKQIVLTSGFINRHSQKDWGFLKYKKSWILLGSGNFTQLKSKIIVSSDIRAVLFKASDNAEEATVLQEASTPQTFYFVPLFQDQMADYNIYVLKMGVWYPYDFLKTQNRIVFLAHRCLWYGKERVPYGSEKCLN